MDISDFYYLRHGITQANLDGLMCGGAWDLPLSEKGFQQATDVSKRLAPLLLPRPPVIYSSPLLRARQTANLVAAELRVPITFVDGLREWDMGEWDGLPFERIGKTFLGGGEPAHGESRSVFGARVKNTLQSIVGSSPTRPLLIGHGGYGLLILELMALTGFRMLNCVPYLFQRVEGKWAISEVFPH